MDREILFRGKSVKNNKWVYGPGIIRRCGCIEIWAFVSEYLGFGSNLDNVDFVTVQENTVGQYTGLKDKNDVKIFEGDIVRVADDEGDTNFVDGGIGTILFLSGMWYIDLSVSNSLYDMSDCYYIEVIGNVYDNPELLT